MLAALDHLLLGINDLDGGIDWVERMTGVHAVPGGSHPGRGTRNALLALGPTCYLEIIAPDPEQHAPTWFGQILGMTEPRLVAWAAHTRDIAALAQAAMSAGLAIDGPQDGSRNRPDGKTLRWKSFRLKDDRGGLLPFFIEWDRDSVHPAGDAPKGCQLERFSVQTPGAEEMSRALVTFSVDVPIESAVKPCLLARISSPKGTLELTS